MEPSNLPYAVAKIAGKVMCDAYRTQHGFNAFTAMPSNVYGIGDNFHPENSHVVAGMMRRFHEAARLGHQEVMVWGTGSPMRELIYADDLGDACVFLMENYDGGGLINAGSSQEISIRGLAQLLASVTGFHGRIVFDDTKPDGSPRKLMDNSRIEQLGWRARTSLREGLENMYSWWMQQQPNHLA
jgi:GDP-L-fucose synthase